MPESPLTPDLIVTEAISLLNEEGIEGISLRKLAARLGIKAPSLYWHFADKSALLAAILERRFYEGLDTVPRHRDWRDFMRAFGIAMWRTQQDTRDFGRLVTTTALGDAHLERIYGRIRAALEGTDLGLEEAYHIQSSVQALVLGWSAFAHAPYASKLAERLDFNAMVLEDLELLIAGEELKLAGRKAR